MRVFLNGLILCSILVTSAPAAEKFLPAGREKAKPPMGWTQFCKDPHHQDVCAARPTGAVRVELTPQKMMQLQNINSFINADVALLSDQEHYGVLERWAYPSDGKGDCEDVDLIKQWVLLQLGWPREALRLAVTWLVEDRSGEGHSVLVVTTSKGDLVLDSREEEILLWSEKKELAFVKWQAPGGDPNKWVYVDKQIKALQSSAKVR